MARTQFSIATFNLYNLNEPGLALYHNSDPWSQAEYERKIAFTGASLAALGADVFGFQELWHARSLENAFAAAGLSEDYTLMVPEGHDGGRIVCAGAARKAMLTGDPEWIRDFPDGFKLASGGDDPQAERIDVTLGSFSRPVLHFQVRPEPSSKPTHVYVCHFKSKAPTILGEADYAGPLYAKHRESLGYAISTIRRTAEAAALKMILTERMKDTDAPVIVLGDINDGEDSNTLAILTGQPRFLQGFSTGGGDTDLYSAQTLQKYRSTRDVYYTYIYQGDHGSLDHILVSQELYDNSRRRIWAFRGLDIVNDQLNETEHRERGTNDHGIVKARFEYYPADAAMDDA